MDTIPKKENTCTWEQYKDGTTKVMRSGGKSGVYICTCESLIACLWDYLRPYP